MLRQRTPDRGRFGPHYPEVFAVLLALAAVAGIGVPFVLSTLESRGSDCLHHLVSEMDGTLPKDAVCPKSGKPYVVVTQDYRTVLGCPAPDGHLNSVPEFFRDEGGPWCLRQISPPSAGRGIEFQGLSAAVTASPGRLSIHLTPTRLARTV